jgi:hypothetical protein
VVQAAIAASMTAVLALSGGRWVTGPSIELYARRRS